MSFGKWFGVFFLGLGCSIAARAQLGVYGMYSATQFSSVPCSAPSGQCSSADGKVSPTGGWGGVYYDFKTFGPVRFGVDFRAGTQHANKSASSSAGGNNITYSHVVLGGVRGAFNTPIKWLRPYGEVLAGWNRNDVQSLSNYVQFEVKAGADIKLLPFLDLRAVELGIGDASPVGGTSGLSSLGVKTIGAGVVVHLPTP